MQISALRAHIG